MGRKPNQLILDFFERGRKLDDQSNRYEQTCKRCGLLFPKGRPDTLNRHLFEQCANISNHDRAQALAFAQGQMNSKQIAQRLGYNPSETQMSQASHPSLQYSLDPQSLGTGNAPVVLNREPSALDTLAEVSRQHLDLSRQRFLNDGIPQHAPEATSESQQEMDSWMVQLSQHLAQENGNNDMESMTNYMQDSNPPTSQANAGSLVQAANAANQLQASLQPTADASNGRVTRGTKRQKVSVEPQGNLDPALRAMEEVLPEQRPNAGEILETEETVTSSLQDPTEAHVQAQFEDERRLVSGEARYGLLSKPLKRQSRSKFTDEGRKKVGGIRRVGACLRCKMLKKPCSGDTPCATCSAVGSPRLWQTACIRTRIAEEFTLFKTEHFATQAKAAVAKLTDGATMQAKERQMRLELPGISQTLLRFDALVYVKEMTRTADTDKNIEPSPHGDTLFVLPDRKDNPTNLEDFLSGTIPNLVAQEPTTFVKVTLSKLHWLAQIMPGDTLMSQTLTLWVATRMLISPSDFHWQFNLYESAKSDGPKLPLSESRADHAILKSQLLSAIESLSARLFRQCANELERRLLARATTSPSATYFSALVLLNVVERTSLFYRRLDTGSPPDSKETAALVNQGTRFAEILVMLLRMRQLPPKTLTRDDGSLTVVKALGRMQVEEIMPVPEAESRTDLGVDEKDVFLMSVAAWLAETGVGVTELLEKVERRDDDENHGSWTAADMRFSGKLVVPENLTLDDLQGRSQMEGIDGDLADEVFGRNGHGGFEGVQHETQSGTSVSV